MGRDAGWLTAAAGLPSLYTNVAPDLVYLPEVPFDFDQFYADLEKAFEKHPNVVVAVSEGVELDWNEIGEDFQSGKTDNFGHKYLAGVGKALEKVVSREIGCKVRSIELNVMQRCSSHLSSKRDVAEAERIGGMAVSAAMEGISGEMMVFRRVSNRPYNVRIEHVEISKVANRVKYFPDEWINESGNNVTDEAVEYCLPLIQGEQNIHIKNGLPQHYVLRRDLPRKK
jgi:6-phosphofructokinase 1